VNDGAATTLPSGSVMMKILVYDWLLGRRNWARTANGEDTTLSGPHVKLAVAQACARVKKMSDDVRNDFGVVGSGPDKSFSTANDTDGRARTNSTTSSFFMMALPSSP